MANEHGHGGHGNDGHEGHSHGPTAADLASGATNRRIWPMVVSVAIIATFFVVEIVAGLALGSLALVADAGHMLTDVVALIMGLAALLLARHGSITDGRSFGWYRAEVFTAVINAVLLIGVGIFVLVEAIRRIGTDPEVPGGAMIIVAVLGLIANLVVMLLLRADVEGSLAVRGAYLEVLADAVGSVGVLVAGVIVMTTGWGYADLVVAVLIALWVVPRAIKLAKTALTILNQQAPKHVDLDIVRADLAAIDGVNDVHDLHVWSVTTGMDVVSVHLTSAGDNARVLADARQALEAHGLGHATVQIESPGDKSACSGELTW